MHKRIFVTTRFIHFHRWQDAPEAHAYLRKLHRHEFHVRMEVPVTESNREIEFIQLKEHLNAVIGAMAVSSWAVVTYGKDHPSVSSFNGIPTIEWSCEHWCEYLLHEFPAAAKVEVSEDGENGAYITRNSREQWRAQSEQDNGNALPELVRQAASIGETLLGRKL